MLTKEQIQEMPTQGKKSVNTFYAASNYIACKNNSYKDRADMLEWVETEVMGAQPTRNCIDFKSDREYVNTYCMEIN